MSEKDGKLFKAKSTDRWPSRVHNMTSSFEKECSDARSLLDQLAKYLLNRSYNSSSDSFMKKMRELNVATFTVMEFNKTLEKLIPNENKFNPDGSDSESLYSCYDQPSMKSFTVNQWINKNDKCSQESSSKPTEQEVDQEQDHRDLTPGSEVLKKAAGMSINQIADVGEASVGIDKSEESVASNDLAVKSQNEMPVIFKCRPMVELMARDSESIPETDSDSVDSSKHSESTPDDHFAGNSASEDKVQLHIPPQIPLEMNIHVDCLVTHVESPSRFYVVSRAAKSSLDILIKGAEFDKSFHYTTKCELSHKICYACFYDRTWSRVRLINLLKNDVDDVEVFFIDTGRKEYVQYYNLTPLHEKFYSLPAIAYLCHLFKVTPLTTSNGVWTFAALKYMKNKVQGLPGKITPTEFVNDSYGVLLSMNDNKLTTINLTMIIKNLAHDLNDTPVRPVSPKTPSKDQLTSAHVNVPPTQILKDEYIECVVTHVESPSSFYVTHAEDDGMPAKLKSYYQEYKPTFKNSSECTQPFYACLHEDVWWRALVVDASYAADELTMFFLDSGLKTNINVSHVRPLAVEFCNVAPKAFLCHLFRVEPLKENGGWTNKAIKFMKKKTLYKKGRLFVENTLQTKFEASNGVILIVDSITLNVTLVVKNLAQEPDEVSAEPESNIELMSPNLNQSNTSLSIHEVPAEAAQIAAESPVKIKSVASISPQNNHSTPPSLTNVSTDPSMPYNNFNPIISTLSINNVSTMTSKDTPNISVPPKHSPKILAPPANSSNDSVKSMYSPKNSVPLMYSPNFSVQQKYSPKMSVPPTHSPNMSVPPPIYSPHISPYISVPPPYSPNSSVPRIHFYNNMSTLPPLFSPKNNIDRMQPKLSPHNNVAGESSMHSPNTSVSPMFLPNISLNKAPCEPKSPNNNLSPYKTSSTLPHSHHEDGKVKQISPHHNVQMVPSDLPHDNDCAKMRPMSLPNNNLSPYKTSSTLPHSHHEDGKVKQISPHHNVQMVPSDLSHDNHCAKMRPMSLPNNNLSPHKTSSTLPHSHEDGKVKQISSHHNVQMVPSDLSHDNDCAKMRPMSLPNNNLSPYKTSSTLPHSRHEDGKVKQLSSHHNVQMVPSDLSHDNDCAKMRPMSLPNNNLSPHKTSSTLPHSRHEDGKVKQISPHHNVQMVPSDLPHDNDCAKMRPMSLPNNNLSPYKTSSTLPHSHHEDGKVKQISSHHNVQMIPSDSPHDNDCAKMRPMSLPNNNFGSGTSMQHLVNDVRKENSMVPNNKKSSMQHLVKNVNWRTSMYHSVNDVSREIPIVPNNNSDIVMSNNDFQSVTTSMYERSTSIINPVVPDCDDLEVLQLKPLHSNNISKKKSMLPPNKNVNAMSSVPKDDDVDTVKHDVISTEINNLTAELTNKPSIGAFMPKSSYSKVSTVPSLLPHFCNVGASPLRLTLDSNSNVPSKMSLCDVNVPSLMSTVCNWPTLGSSRRNEVNRHQFMGQVLDLDLPASRVTKKKRGFLSKYATSETSIKNNSPPSLKDNKNIKGRAITKSTNNKIKSINTLEAAFQGICLESHTKGKTSVTSSPKKTNVKPRPELNSVTSNLGKTNVTSSVLAKNNVTPSETTLVAKSARVVNVPVDDVDYSILNQPMGSELENLNLSRAAQGFTANDEAEVCAHYKGPPDTTCFKGAGCKKKHILLHRDGWTVKQISAIVDTKNELKLPPSDSLITVSMTQVETCCSFYGHILDSNSTSGSQLLCDDPNGMPEPLQKLLKTMNGEAALKELKPYSTLEDLPGLGELVAALFPMDGLWYRARVLEADSDEVEVLYVDFGNRACLRYEQIARLLPLFGELPVQAVRFVLGNVQIPADPTKALTAAQAFFELTQNKRLCALVLSVEVDDLHVILYDSNADDVGIIMASMDLVETKDYRVINYGDRIISEDAIRLNKTVRCVEQNKKDVILHGVQFNGLFPG